ncbi:hypothetical protein PIB30_006334 [Stylosanthes scabra]|uniref:Uncharacterized protein n=1 Tax=Stylosanthes scabra TaxID=79078 RepID=A0ABU6R377_9FABA|nr:hypothetical protein [Stylosanthes scabra]
MSSTELKKGWSGNTVYPVSAPPLQLVAIVGIVVFLLWTSSYMNYKASMQTATANTNLLVLILPVLLLLIALYGRLAVPVKHYSNNEDEPSSSPIGLAAMASLVLVLIYHQPHLIFVVAILFLYTYVLSG